MVHAPTTGTTVKTNEHMGCPQYTIITLNVAGLLPYKFRGKVKLLAEMAQVDNALILSLTESHLTENIREAEMYIENYTSFRTDRSGQRKKGGIVTYVNNHPGFIFRV